MLLNSKLNINRPIRICIFHAVRLVRRHNLYVRKQCVVVHLGYDIHMPTTNEVYYIIKHLYILYGGTWYTKCKHIVNLINAMLMPNEIQYKSEHYIIYTSQFQLRCVTGNMMHLKLLRIKKKLGQVVSIRFFVVFKLLPLSLFISWFFYEMLYRALLMCRNNVIWYGTR